MKLMNLLFVLLTLSLMVVACEQKEPETPKPEVTLTLTSDDTMTYGSEGGNGTITFILEGADAQQPQATCEAAWISNIIASTHDITFDVEANSGEARQTVIVATYDDKSFSVTIMQEEYIQPNIGNECDIVLDAATYIPPSTLGLSNTYYFIGFNTDDMNNYCALLLLDSSGEPTLQPGLYDTENCGFATIQDHEITVDGQSISVVGGMATVTVEQDVYSFDFTFVGVDDKLYHFTYDGQVTDMPTGVTEMIFQANFLEGNYYGYLDSTNAHNVSIYLSDIGLDETTHNAKANGTYYCIDLYCSSAKAMDGYIMLAEGEYTLDRGNTYLPGTMTYNYTTYTVVGDTADVFVTNHLFDSARLVITETGITFEGEARGVKHTVTYEGTPHIYNGV